VLRKSDSIFICVMACIVANTPWSNAAFGSGALPTTGATAGGAPPTGGCTGGGTTGIDGRAGGCITTGLVICTPLALPLCGISIALASLTFFTYANDPVIAYGCVCIRSPYNMIGTSNGSQSGDSVSAYRRWPISMQHISSDDRS